MLSMPPGPKTEVSDNYLAARKSFEERLSKEQAQKLFEEGKHKGYMLVVHDDGRKYDKILVAYSPDAEAKPATPKVRYFIDRSNGQIFGAKSPMAPNIKWYFGTIYEAELWDWSGYHAVPLDESAAGVKKVGDYGNYNHYEKVA
jgi:hypothetical protein